MKKIIIAFIVVLASFVLTGCGKATTPLPTKSQSSTEVQEQAVASQQMAMQKLVQAMNDLDMGQFNDSVGEEFWKAKPAFRRDNPERNKSGLQQLLGGRRLDLKISKDITDRYATDSSAWFAGEVDIFLDGVPLENPNDHMVSLQKYGEVWKVVDMELDIPPAQIVTAPPSSTAAMDSDQDGLSNEEEAKYGSNPNNPDTDADGYIDGEEVRGGYNPNGSGKLVSERDSTPVSGTLEFIVVEQDIVDAGLSLAEDYTITFYESMQFRKHNLDNIEMKGGIVASEKYGASVVRISVDQLTRNDELASVMDRAKGMVAAVFGGPQPLVMGDEGWIYQRDIANAGVPIQLGGMVFRKGNLVYTLMYGRSQQELYKKLAQRIADKTHDYERHLRDNIPVLKEKLTEKE